MRRERRLCRCLRLALACCAAGALRAQQLPIHRYDVRDGLAHSRVDVFYQDHKGYLWIGTWEGLSRFDGSRFTNYGTREGLPNPIVNCIAEDGRGRLWVGTHGGGLARLLDDPGEDPDYGSAGFDPVRRPRFCAFPVAELREANVVSSLRFDAGGRLWCGTQGGIYRGEEQADGSLRFALVAADPTRLGNPLALGDRQQRVCFLTRSAWLRTDGDAVASAPLPPREPEDDATALLGPEDGRWMVAYDRDLFRFDPDAPEASRWERVPLALPPGLRIRALARDAHGALWIGTTQGLLQLTDAGQRRYTTAEGLSDDVVHSLLADREGNLWIGTFGGGACRLSREPIESITRAQGLPSANAQWLVQALDGRMYATLDAGGIVELEDGRARPLAGSERPPFANTGMRLLQDRRGDWWVGTDQGVYRFPGPELQLEHGQLWSAAEGGPPGAFAQMFEDAAGRIWMGGMDQALYCFEPDRRAAPWFRRFELAQPDDTGLAARSFGADRAGTLWLAPYNGIWRGRDGVFEALAPGAGIPDPHLTARAFLMDRRGWLWIALRFHGVVVTREPEAAQPQFRDYGTADGLASDAVWGLAEDERGRIYLGTGRGLDQLDPASGRVRHFGVADGLAGDVVNCCLRDREGRIWAATSGGVSRLDPRSEPAAPAPPPVYIRSLELAGEPVALPESGTQRLGGLRLAPDRASVRIEYAGIDLASDQGLRFQFRMLGLGEDWCAPSAETAVHYGGLAPGHYRFEVRAVNRDGLVSPEAAVAELRVLPPFWRQWWFVALAAGAGAAAVLLAHRARLRRAVAMERIRTQIATDLHDDVGAGLSQIAILSEVARRGAEPDAAGVLGEVAALARGLRESMSDIVWSVDPRKDRLSDLVARMRSAAWQLFASEDGSVEFQAPPDAALAAVELPPDRRRHLLLLFKEAAANAARHAGAARLRVEVALRDGELRLRVEDDGRGFDPGAVVPA